MNKGQRIRKAREDIGISQTELASRIGVSKQNLYKYENSIITNIPSDKIEAISRVCNVSPEYIMGWSIATSSIPSELDMEFTRFGEKIKNLRISLGLTQEDLAIAAGTTKQTIHKYETGIITNIPASKVKALADKLATTPAYLMGWQDEDDTRTSAQILADSIKNRKAKLVAHGGDGVKYIDHISREEYESFFPESAKKCILSNGIETTEITKEEFEKIKAFLKMIRE